MEEFGPSLCRIADPVKSTAPGSAASGCCSACSRRPASVEIRSRHFGERQGRGTGKGCLAIKISCPDFRIDVMILATGVFGWLPSTKFGSVNCA
jgi:hypothetical protein